jgi:hypothetical protein
VRLEGDDDVDAEAAYLVETARRIHTVHTPAEMIGAIINSMSSRPSPSDVQLAEHNGVRTPSYRRLNDALPGSWQMQTARADWIKT